ncbi:MAG: dipeptide/oligopeptide/nickel ABC transporter ATP-binding protein [Butyrivibrio sp.]|nr:dipeptide/oligopeptide/nickel ABC transporter ATP-binding protein [Butyrivibrio sp.]
MPLLQVEKLNKTFQGNNDKIFQALKDVSFSVEEGECVGIIGESGSGKTTIVNIVAGFVPATSGLVVYDGNELTARRCDKNARDTMQMVFQNPMNSFSPRMKLGKGIREGLHYLSSMPRAEQERRVDEAMEMVGLPLSYKNKYVFEVSGGEAQRAAIARAILIKPRLLLCDEITSALDAEVQDQLIELLLNLKKEMNMALLFISHDIKLVRSFCDRAFVLQDGVVVEQGDVKRLYEHPENEYTKRLVNAAILNLI